MIQNIGTENGIIIELLIYTNIKRTPPPPMTPPLPWIMDSHLINYLCLAYLS